MVEREKEENRKKRKEHCFNQYQHMALAESLRLRWEEKKKMLRRRKSQWELICLSLEPKLCSKPDDAMEVTMRQKYV